MSTALDTASIHPTVKNSV